MMLRSSLRRLASSVVPAREFMTVSDVQIAEYIRYLERGGTPGVIVKEKEPLTPLTELLPGPVEGIDLSYKFQDLLIRKRAEKGVTVAAWKVGTTSKTSMKQWGVTEPIIAPVFSSCAYQDMNEISMTKHRILSCEMEFAFRIGKELSPEITDLNEIASCCDMIYPAIEFVGTRFLHRAPHASAFAADLAGNAALVWGSGVPLDKWKSYDLSAFPCVFTFDDEPVATGRGKAVLENPLNSLPILAKNMKARGKALSPGMIVTTGSTCGQVPCKPAKISANFGPLGRVTAQVVP